MKRVVNFLLGVLAGAFVGSVVVTLLTPTSGIELQDQLKDYMSNIQDEVQKARDTRRQDLENQLHQLRKS